MLILKYFAIVGTLLTAGLLAVSSYLEAQHAGRVSRAPTTASVAIVKPAVVADTDLEMIVGPVKPDKPVKPSSAHSSHREGRRSSQR
jgi:hypothetical protein